MPVERRERFALLVVILIVIGLPAAALGYQYKLRPELDDHTVIEIAAVVPENGGFAPDAITVNAGEKVTLRFTSMDVTHGVAIGPGLDADLGHIDPGTSKEITLTFDHPGTYTYYCTSWCSRDHWRMRGTIQVTDPKNPDAVPVPQRDPVIERLIEEGVDIDATLHNSEGDHGGMAMELEPITLAIRPSAERGKALAARTIIPADLNDAEWRFSHTPQQALELLIASNPDKTTNELADVIAYLWTHNADPERLKAAETLYNQNCAACHGPTGDGTGPGAENTAEKPVAFADFNYMFGMRGDVLYAKIRRGGMGTSMPNFGTLFTQDETRMMVDYLWMMPFEQ